GRGVIRNPGSLRRGGVRTHSPRKEPHMSVDDRAFAELIEESDDLHHDAMRETRTSLAEMVEVLHDRGIDLDENRSQSDARRALIGKGIGGGKALAAAGLGGVLLTMMSQPA